MKKATIIGFGRFGKTLYQLLKGDFWVTIYNRSKIDTKKIKSNVVVTNDLAKAYESDIIFYAVAISAFEDVIKHHKQYIRNNHLLIDVLSVKLHPKKIFEKYLKKTKTQILLTHPMFGPDSSKNGFENLPMILDKFKTEDKTYQFWKNFFQLKKLRVIEMTAQEHDRLAANSHGLTHVIGRMLDEYGLRATSIDSLGTKKLLQVKEQTCNDTWQLFNDMQHYNPYTKPMRLKLGASYEKIYNKLLPERVNAQKITVGIQGGRGSFNEEAILDYFTKKNIIDFAIKYVFTSENVLKSLHEGETDLGIFAVHNSAGGIVHETIEAMGKYKFSVVEEISIIISHTLMIRKDATINDITTIMSHPQVFSQCQTTLEGKYPELKKISGEGEMIDHALVAKKLSEKKLPKNIATMGSKILAQMYDLKIVEDNLQDLKKNVTSSLLIKR